jgi:hypothetical protein
VFMHLFLCVNSSFDKFHEITFFWLICFMRDFDIEISAFDELKTFLGSMKVEQRPVRLRRGLTSAVFFWGD